MSAAPAACRSANACSSSARPSPRLRCVARDGERLHVAAAVLEHLPRDPADGAAVPACEVERGRRALERPPRIEIALRVARHLGPGGVDEHQSVHRLVVGAEAVRPDLDAVGKRRRRQGVARPGQREGRADVPQAVLLEDGDTRVVAAHGSSPRARVAARAATAAARRPAPVTSATRIASWRPEAANPRPSSESTPPAKAPSLSSHSAMSSMLFSCSPSQAISSATASASTASRSASVAGRSAIR